MVKIRLEKNVRHIAVKQLLEKSGICTHLIDLYKKGIILYFNKAEDENLFRLVCPSEWLKN